MSLKATFSEAFIKAENWSPLCRAINTFPAMSEKRAVGSVSDNLQVFTEYRFFYSLNFKYGFEVPNIWSPYLFCKIIPCLPSSTPNENSAGLAGRSDRWV